MISADVFVTRMLEAQEAQLKLLRSIQEQLTKNPQAEAVTAWQKANPLLAAACREASETLGNVHKQWLQEITEEIVEKSEQLLDGEFVRQEFIDRHALRLAQFGTLLTTLQLFGGTAPSAQAR